MYFRIAIKLKDFDKYRLGMAMVNGNGKSNRNFTNLQKYPQTMFIKSLLRLLFVCTVARMSSSFQKILSSSRLRHPFLFMSLELKTYKIPLQSDTSNYFRLLKEQVPEHEILRWYISHVESSGFCVIDVVKETNGVGNSVQQFADDMT